MSGLRGRGVRVAIFYGWVIVGVAFVAWAISMGPRQAFSVFLLAFLAEFGWSRGLAAGAFSAHMVFYALGGLALGVVVDRWGPRRVMAWSTGAWALTLLLCSRIQHAWQLYLFFGVLGGIATGGLAYVPNNALLSRWFVRYRGLAAGLSQSGVPLGTAVFGPLTQLAIAAIGWRETYTVYGLAVAVLAVPLILLFLRDDPGEMGLRPDGEPARSADVTAPAGPAGRPESREGERRGTLPPGFWRIFAANVFRGMTMNGILVHQVAYLVDVGYSKMAAAGYFSAGAILAVFGGFSAGGISDRVGRARMYAATCGLYVIGLACLLGVRTTAQSGLVWIFVAASGLALGGSAPVFAALLTDRFHGPRFGFLIGLQNIAFGLGATLGPFLAGAFFDVFGNYAAAFLLLTASIAASAMIVGTMVRRTSALAG
jgi:MFS family permease